MTVNDPRPELAAMLAARPALAGEALATVSKAPETPIPTDGKPGSQPRLMTKHDKVRLSFPHNWDRRERSRD